MQNIEVFDNMEDYRSIPKQHRGIRCVYRNYHDQRRHQPMEHVFNESFFDVYDTPLVDDVAEFLECIEQNGITDFVITCRTTNIIETLAEMQKFGWVCDGVRTVPRFYTGIEWEDMNGIYVHKIKEDNNEKKM